MNISYKKILFAFLGIVFLFRASGVFALEIQYPTILGLSLNDNSTFAQYACYLFGLGANLAILIAILAIAFGGVYYLASYGRGKFTDEGKDWMKAGILGLLIIVSASVIVYTINPNLTTCKIGFLSLININSSGVNPALSGAHVTSYQEIPIGVLTENLLTKTMDCYGFDPLGNPIDGNQVTSDNGQKINAPTYTDHDRADCLLQLTDGAQKKAHVIADLSDKINQLMSTCSCAGKCSDPCNANGNGCQVAGATCAGACTGNNGQGAACAPQQGVASCCAPDVKNSIEHGDVAIGCGGNNAAAINTISPFNDAVAGLANNPLMSNFLLAANAAPNNANNNCQQCDIPAATFKGLDEFRCPNPIQGDHASCTDVESFVETQVQINKQTVTIINQANWKKLNLIQQLTYLKGKISELTQKIQADETQLDKAKTALAHCYLAVPYVDLLKTYEGADNKANLILKDPETFSDSDNQPVSAAKYCTGFNYNNSSCLATCNNECPDTGDKAIQAYKDCGSCTGNNQDCLTKQASCIDAAYNNRLCTQGPDPSQKFSACISSCQDSCSTNCAKEYLTNSSQYTICKNQCTNNSQCVLNNANTCLINSQQFNECANQVTDPGNTQNCIDSAYLCKNGSDQYAGYQDCVNPLPSASKSCTMDSDCPNGQSCGNLGVCVQKYSASFLYDSFINNTASDPEKCPYPDYPPDKSSSCYNNANTTASCQELCPETGKCPAASNCPDCPCDQINNQDFQFSIPNINDGTNTCAEGDDTVSQNISAYQMVGSQCNQYSYNDDPLTFYCEDNWWNDPNREGNNPTPIGTERICAPSGEVPVGQTVDDAETWANNLMSTANDYITHIQGILSDAQKISDKQPNQYCTCDSKYDTGSPICTSNCQYTPPMQGQDAQGNPIAIPAACNAISCNGDSCKQMMDYMTQTWNDARQLSIDYVSFYTSMLQEPRSDIMKELTYSRTQTNSCSAVNSAYGTSDRLLDCSRVEDNLIAPINDGQITYQGETVPSYCYGKNLGDLFNASSLPDGSLTDNWFCCQEFQPTPTPRNQPQ